MINSTKNKAGFKSQVSNFIILSAIVLLLPIGVHAAVLYFDPSEAEYNAGDTLIEEIRLDTQGEQINAVEVHVEYPQDILEVRDFSKGNSILTLWPQEPSYENGALSFIGGVPAGYIGDDGVLGRIIFYVKQVGLDTVAEVTYSQNTKALLNDGAGSASTLTTNGVNISISANSTDKRSDEWTTALDEDNISPEGFDVILSNSPDVYGGNYFIIFSTVDKQTGIDRYEVLEYVEGKSAENKDASSPYLLENQELGGIIRVRAVDKAGNVSVSELRLGEVGKRGFPWVWVILLILVFIGIGVGYRVYKKRTKS